MGESGEVAATGGERAVSTAESRREPPKALFKVINPVMRAILRSPLHGLASNALVVLTYKGRKTGKVYSTPVGYHRTGDGLLVFTSSSWYHNFEGGANVTLTLRGRREPARAEVVQDEDEVFRNVMAILDRIGRNNSRRLGIMLPKGHKPTTEELRTASKGTVMVRLILPQS
ncbi:MAG: nitroreductase/quinone reductase family protein [Chloroflexia bacterium]